MRWIEGVQVLFVAVLETGRILDAGHRTKLTANPGGP